MRTVALAGPPNVGKTTIMSRVCRANLEVGNWPGVTVERKTCTYEFRGKRYRLIDLPGTYSLTAFSEDQRVARDYLLGRTDGKPDAVVVVGDALNVAGAVRVFLEIAELGYHHVILAVNMLDEAERTGIGIDLKRLERELGAPVVGLSAKRGYGIERLKRAIADVVQGRVEPNPISLRYPREVERAVKKLAPEVGGKLREYPPRWAILKLLEGDPELLQELEKRDPELLKRVKEVKKRIAERTSHDPAVLISQARDELATRIARSCVTGRPSLSRQDRIDRVLTHPVWGTLFALGVLGTVFALSFFLGDPISELVEGAFDHLVWFARGLPAPWSDVFAEGVIPGVGTVLAMYPYVFVMLLLLTVLEDVGYTARLAALASGLLARLGLHGKTVFPAVLSLSCNVPGITASRIIEDERARLLTAIVVPMIPCGARLEVITFLTAKLPDPWRVPAAVSIYVVALSLFAVTSYVLHRLLFGKPEPHRGHVIELPRLRKPHLRTVLTVTWLRSNEFLQKAGTIILAASVLLWTATRYPKPLGTGGSAIELVGKSLEPVTVALLGLDWKGAVAPLNGIVAKEIVISTLAMLHAHPTPENAYVLTLVSALYIPCAATIGAVYSETGSLRYTALSVAANLSLATLVGAAAHHALVALGGWTRSYVVFP
ncbi:ferrous iron transport protein B [Methanopyrus sp. SNP6]|uniref:ferrous iron transport protein B n=1 Tax=Methanopyrus sp. SNP6 TaxID=1937005 RepID=UPI0011E592CB|nr:ferrous iron transport protein B [Methanopyrus sp. SNP6]